MVSVRPSGKQKHATKLQVAWWVILKSYLVVDWPTAGMKSTCVLVGNLKWELSKGSQFAVHNFAIIAVTGTLKVSWRPKIYRTGVSDSQIQPKESAVMKIWVFVLQNFDKCGRTDKWRVRTVITTGRDCGSASWINDTGYVRNKLVNLFIISLRGLKAIKTYVFEETKEKY